MYWPHLIFHFSSLTLAYTGTYPYTFNSSTTYMVTVDKISNAQLSHGPAVILAIGTATPPNFICQASYPDFCFRITNRPREKSMIKKRHMHLKEEFLKENPNMCTHMAPSLDVPQDMVVVEVPKLGKEAAVKAIQEWGQPKSMTTHLVFCTSSGVDMPGADYRLTKLLGLRPSVKRLMIYQQGCAAGGTVLHLAKDLAENNRGARVLVVCSEITALFFLGPSETHVDSLVGQALFGDGAAAIIVGAHPDTIVEHPIFQLVSVAQTILPDSGEAIKLGLREAGLTFHLQKDVPDIISMNIKKCLVEAVTPIGINDWIMHSGGRVIVDQTEEKLGLEKEKLEATRHVLSEYGNLVIPCVLFILDEMRNKSLREGKATTGEGLEWGSCSGFGPGITVERVVLHSVPVGADHWR